MLLPMTLPPCQLSSLASKCRNNKYCDTQSVWYYQKTGWNITAVNLTLENSWSFQNVPFNPLKTERICFR
jgi:hypothetical protein